MNSPGPKLLNDVELAAAKTLILPLLPDYQKPLVSAALDSTRRIYDAYMTLSSGDRGMTSSYQNSQRLELITNLDNLTDGDFDLGAFYWSVPTYVTITDVAKSYTLSIYKNFRNLPYFQTKIWENQAAAVFYSLFNSSTVSFSDSNVKNGCLQACNTSISRNYAIGKDSIDTILYGGEYQNARMTGGEPMKEIFRRLWRFCPLVKFPHDVAYLLNSSFASASQIANTPRNTFVTTMAHFGMQDENAVLRLFATLRVMTDSKHLSLHTRSSLAASHDHSLTVELRNEQIWTALLASKSNWAPASIVSSTRNEVPTANPSIDSGPKQVIRYTNMFGDINVNVCDDCSSVTGPAAYFVDLLRMLKNALSNPQSAGSPTLLDKLFARRPDLRNLQLSCANVNTLLPYIDLVNEIMESFVQNLASAGTSGTVAIQAYNVDDQDKSEDLIVQPQAINYNVYRQQIASQVFPPNVFPYSQAIDTMRSYFNAFGSSRYEFLTVFASKYRLNADRGSTGRGAYKQAEKVLDYALASELLDLQPDDFVAITSNSVFSFEYYQSTGETSWPIASYNQWIGLLSAAQYWGYSSIPSQPNQTATDLMISESEGISLVTSQLLPRAAISVQDLLDILKTRFLGGTLALQNAGNTPLFSGDISDLRLRHPLEEAWSGSTSYLTEEDCYVLQAFLRLWRKSPLSMKDLDLVLSYFSDRRGSPTTTYPRITSDVITALAALQQVIKTTGRTVETLMPFYGLIDTYGDNPLYAKLFLQGKSNKTDSVFGKSGNGRYLDNDSQKISDNRSTLLAALGILDEHWNALILAANIPNDILNLSSLSAIYRIALFCKIMDISPFQYSAFISLFGKGFSPFKSPQATLDTMKSWQACLDAGFDIEQVLYITGKDLAFGVKNSGYGISIDQLVAFVSNILTGLIATERSIPPAEAINAAVATASEITRISTLMFDPVTAAKVKDFIEAPSTTSSVVYQDILSQYFKQSEQEAQSKFFNQTQPSGTPEEIAISLEAQAVERRLLFLRSISPLVRLRLTNELILEQTRTLFPELHVSLVRFLLSEVIFVGTPARSALDALSNSLAINNAALNGPSIQAYYTPASTDFYRFYVPDPQGTNRPTIALDGAVLTFEPGNQGWISNELPLVNGQEYLLTRANGNFASCTYFTRRTPSLSFGSDVLIDKQTTSSCNNMVLSALRAAHFITKLKLDLSEVTYMQRLPSTNPLAVDFGAISYGHIRKIQQYTLLRDRLESPSLTIIEFFKWASFQDQDIGLAEKLSNVTNIPALQVQAFLDAKYPEIVLNDRVKVFQDAEEIGKLVDAWTLMSRLGVPGLTFKSLFKWATPLQPAATATISEFDNAMELRVLTGSLSTADGEDSVLAKANNILRNNQRRALINYLIQQDYMRSRFIYDESNLFDFFLIDVQMGSDLKTSRLKQGISTVQLFIQRCIIGLEKAQGISSNTINLDRWSWMQKYRLWEASRKVFLYPENWLDPTLRDDKSEAFRVLEDSILQTDLSQSTLDDQVRTYLYAASEVADLDVQAYQWDKVGSYSGKFHLFARTRHAPYSYYYRSLEISSGTSPKVFWQPWSKIDVEVPAIETDGDGKALPVPGSYLVPALYGRRLFLFLPQVTLKTISDPTSSASIKTFQQLGNENARANVPTKFWQVQMGWTEYRNGRWSPKQMSSATLSAAGSQTTDLQMTGQQMPRSEIWTEGQKFPAVSSFRFSILSRQITVEGAPQSVLNIDVERCIGPVGDLYYSYPLGRFELQGQRLVLGDSFLPSLLQRRAFAVTIPTSFGKQSFRTSANDNNSLTPNHVTVVNYSYNKPEFGFVSGISGLKDQKWTLSFDESRNDRVTGYVLDISTGDTRTSYFTYPLWPSNSGVYSSDVLQNNLTPRLLDSSTTYDNLDQMYKILGEIPTAATNLTFGKRNGPWHELSTPNALYNWELGVHVIMLIMERLQTTQQFGLALNVAHYIFDPTIDGTSMDRCWKFLPFKEIAKERIETAEDILKRLTPTSGGESNMQVSILEWRKNPFTAHSIARSRTSAYMKRIVMKYIEILIASGDEYFRQNTLETIPFAIQRYIEASQVFGAAPRPIPKLAKSKPVSYADLELTLNDFSNARFDMELDFPYYSDPDKRGGGGVAAPYALTGILKSTYFCVPTNPKLLDLGALINDRLFKIRNSQDINGVTRSLSLFDPPLDPGIIMQSLSRGISLTALLNDSIGPMPNFRFAALLEKALEMCAELKQTGASFLAVRETKDAEGLAALQSRQESLMQSMTIDIKSLAKTEIEKSIAELQETRKGQVSRLQFFLELTGDDAKEVPGETADWDDIVQTIEKPTTDDLRMTSNEKLEMTKNESASRLASKALGLDMTAAMIRAVPDIQTQIEPLGVGTSIGAITVNISDALAMGAGIMRSVAQTDMDVGARAARKADLIRQLQERRMEANAAGRDVKVTDKQIETMRVRLAICEEDIKQQRQQIAHAAEMSEFLRNKYTSEQLYAWMDGQIRHLFYQTYLLANELAKKAQKVYRFERSADAVEYVGQGYWDSSRDGLLSGENLYLALKRMEAAYLEKRGHDFEITKNVSVRQVQPLALFTLRETGIAEFSLPEVLFDFDFPGHYFRRIKTVNVTIASSTDLSAGINTTLTLLEHRYRIRAKASSGQDYLRRTSGDDDRFRTDQIPISSIAVSQSSQDSGVFDYVLEFNDYQRYVPFEGAGAISKWRIELPMPIKQFDYNTINDVTIQIKYTANAEGAGFRKAASDAAKSFQNSVSGLSSTEGLFAVIDLKSDFPTQWTSLTSSRSATLSGLQNRLPFYTKGRTVRVESISALVQSTTATAWATNLTLTGSSSVTWTNGPDIGSSKVVRATGLAERFTNWTIGLTVGGSNAGPQSIIFVIRYYLGT